MKYSLHALFAASILSLSINSLQAQTISSFDDLTLPTPESNFASTLSPDSSYSFQSGLVAFYGSSNAWGSYSGFNYSNETDDTTQSFTNDKSAITGIGWYGSSNYGIAYVPIDFMGLDPTATIPVGVGLKDSAKGHPVAGAYFTNSTYAYYYMTDSTFKAAHHWLKLTIRGYLNGQNNMDSVNYMLADFRDSLSILVNNWEWVDLSTLGNVDSLTFDLSSDDSGSFGINVPAYFAMDNLTTNESGSGINTLNSNKFQLTVSPNPVTDRLSIHGDKALNIIVYNLQGKIILHANAVTEINVSTLLPGIYFLKAATLNGDQSGITRFVKR